MTAENASHAAQAWLQTLPEELDGHTVQLVTFESEEACRFFYPRRALAWQRQVNTFIARGARKRGARIARVILSPEAFMREGQPDTEAERRAFADSYHRLL